MIALHTCRTVSRDEEALIMLIAIDGTGSREWRRDDGSNSFTARFVHQYDGPKPRLEDTHGPDTLGTEVPRITARQISRARAGYTAGVRTFDIVGHSRGGHIAILVASAIGREPFRDCTVRFLGLFDAVDRSPTLSWSFLIPSVVHRCRHALRNPLTLNRTSFGNTGRIGFPPEYMERVFWASHGAIGGDPAQEQSFGGLAGPNTLLTPPSVDRLVSERVWRWMRRGAVDAGVPLRRD